MKRVYLYLEFGLLFFGLPLLLYFERKIIHPSILLLPVIVFVILMLRGDKDFSIGELFTLRIKRERWVRSIMVLVLATGMLLAGTLLFEKENLFNLPRRNPAVFIALCFFYPAFSAYTQEIIYRTFLFHRYGPIFSRQTVFILASSISFSFLHIVYYSPVSMVLTLFAGLYLSYVYWQTKSVLFTTILHGIFGILVFAVGLGHYFWLDMPV
ncbi:MAG: CPBP family intramembrane metalloprotease [Bacteroidales bacterium]|nr:CPBP family intramembrane metalloprotease [Bacteroidales bacterium]MBN2698815.1 CPBP family intramembrane metalloprotease [Bacteroidales bacterium]